MTRVVIFFVILFYFAPALVVVRAFYHNTKANILKEAKNRFKHHDNLKVRERAESNYIEGQTSALFFLCLFAFVGWPFVLVGQFINKTPSKDRKRKQELLEQQLKLSEQMAVWAAELKKFPTDKITKDTYDMLNKQFEELEKQLKEYDEL